MQAIGRQPQRAPDGAPLHYERHRPERTTLYRLVQQHAAGFIAHTEASTGMQAELGRLLAELGLDTFEQPEVGDLLVERRGAGAPARTRAGVLSRRRCGSKAGWVRWWTRPRDA